MEQFLTLQSAQKPTACLKWEKDGFLKFHALPTICPSFPGMAPKTLTYFTFVCFQFFLFIFDALLTICLYLLSCPFKCQHSFPVLFLVVVSLFVIFFGVATIPPWGSCLNLNCRQEWFKVPWVSLAWNEIAFCISYQHCKLLIQNCSVLFLYTLEWSV